MAERAGDIRKKEASIPAGTERTQEKALYEPYVDIIERKDDILLLADMPGIDETSVDITLEKNILTIYGRVREEITETNRPDYIEYGVGDYQRAFTLSEEVDRDKIQASMRNGVLRLIMPKSPSPKSRKITVTAGPEEAGSQE